MMPHTSACSSERDLVMPPARFRAFKLSTFVRTRLSTLMSTPTPPGAKGVHIDEQHIAEPGLVVLDITAADEGTLRTVMNGLQQQWATSGVVPVWRTSGEDGVRARVYADIRCTAPH